MTSNNSNWCETRTGMTSLVSCDANGLTSQRLPIGIFWDFENCTVPKDKSIIQLIVNIRTFICMRQFRETEFIAVCDIRKFQDDIVDQMNNLQLTVVHVSGIAKNAADDKLKQLISRFIDTHTTHSALLVLTDDINFSCLLSDLRNRRGVHIILFQRQAAQGLLACANEVVNFDHFCEDLPLRIKQNIKSKDYVFGTLLLVKNLPSERKLKEIKKRLNQLIANCGGKLIKIENFEALIRFACVDDARRALQRINGEDVYGKKIEVSIYKGIKQAITDSDNSCESNSSDLIPNKENYKPTETQSVQESNSENMSYLDNRHRQVDSHDEPNTGFKRNVTIPNRSVRNSPLERNRPNNQLIQSNSSNKKSIKTKSQMKINSYSKLVITNLDSTLERKEIEKLLTKMLREHKISFIRIDLISSQHSQRNSSINSINYTKTNVTTFNYIKAIIVLPNPQEVQLAIYRLHGEKIGFKRISISTTHEKQPKEVVESQIISLFEDIPTKKVSLVTFQELFENRFYTPISLSDIYKMNNIISVCVGRKGKYVMLNPTLRFRSNSNSLGSDKDKEVDVNHILPYCSIHSNQVENGAWAELLSANKNTVPVVNISLVLLSPRMHHLLDIHGGSLPLHSIVDCYIKVFNEGFDILNPPLVSLEHLITCIPGVSIIKLNNSKHIIWQPNKDIDEISLKTHKTNHDLEILDNKLIQFGKEVRELLKSQPHSIILFNRFVPTYHSHYGRQCVVNDFGFVKLNELLEAIPYIVQIFGENCKRMITLTHREQTKRFASDLIKVLKIQKGRQIMLNHFASAYFELFQKHFDISDYGVCYIDDIIRDVWEGTVIISQIGNDKCIELPKRDRSLEEIKRTKYFSQDVYQLLITTPNFELTFSKFIPSYHHYFNKQCRVMDYGFIKLIDLLEEISPNVIEIELKNVFEERIIRLNIENRIKALAHRFEVLLKTFETRSITISKLCELYKDEYGCNINFAQYYSNDFIDLINKMPKNKFRILQYKSNFIISLMDNNQKRIIGLRLSRILMEEMNGEMQLSLLDHQYCELYGESVGDSIFSPEFSEIIEVIVSDNIIKLSPILMFARTCILLMHANAKEKFTLDDLEALLMDKFDRPLPQPYNYKCTSFVELFRRLSDYFTIEKKGKPGKFLLLISLNKSLRKFPLIVKEKEPPKIRILKRSLEFNNAMPTDLLNINDIPPDLPLPELTPLRCEHDLISWSSGSDENESSLSLMDFEDSTHDSKFASFNQIHETNENESNDHFSNRLNKKPNRIAANIFV